MSDPAEITRKTYERAAQALLDELEPRPESPHAKHHAHILARLTGRPSMRAVVMGSAAPVMLREFNDQGAVAIGLDYSKAALRVWQRELQGTSLVCANLQRLPFAKSSLDALYADALLGHIARRDFEETVRGIRDALRPGGVLGVRLKLGEGERLENHKQVPGQVWRSYWTMPEFVNSLNLLDFDVRHEQQMANGRSVFLVLRREY